MTRTAHQQRNSDQRHKLSCKCHPIGVYIVRFTRASNREVKEFVKNIRAARGLDPKYMPPARLLNYHFGVRGV